jgi:transcriptional regulator with XRE-family HTH domain
MGEQKNPLGAVGREVKANVERLRKGQQLTYVALAERTRQAGRPIPVLGLRRIEAGERRVDVDDLAVPAAAFGVRPEQLLEPFNKDAEHLADMAFHFNKIEGRRVEYRTPPAVLAFTRTAINRTLGGAS